MLSIFYPPITSPIPFPMSSPIAFHGSSKAESKNKTRSAVPSNVKAGSRVPTSAPMDTSLDASAGPLDTRHSTELTDDHAAVPHATPSMRLLGVASLCPKLSPPTETIPSMVRAEFVTPR